jgi:hypothetical protein
MREEFWFSLAGFILQLIVFLIDLKKRLLSDKEEESPK